MNTNQKQDGIEERAKAIEYSDQNRRRLFKGTAIDYVRLRADKHEKKYGDQKQADHLRRLADEAEKAQAETAALTTQLNEMREALRELLESAKHAQMETHETFTSNTLFDAVVKAEKIFDTDAQ